MRNAANAGGPGAVWKPLLPLRNWDCARKTPNSLACRTRGCCPCGGERDGDTQDSFNRAMQAWPADMLVVPSPRDQHPDHRGMFLFAMEALKQIRQTPAVFSYLIHPGLFRRYAKGPALQLTPEQQAAKLEAILCHKTQIALSRGRFCSYAGEEEIFNAEPLPEIYPVPQPIVPVG